MSVTGVQKKRTGQRSTVAVISVLTMLVAMLGIVSPAQAAVDDGTLTVSVARTFTETGVADPAGDVPQEGMQVTVTDAAGASVSGVTGADGNFVLAPDATLAGGRYRIEVVIPAAYDHLEPAFAALGETYRSHVGFVDVSAGADATYRTAVWNPADYIQAAPAIAVPFQSGQGAVGTTQALVEFSSSPRGNAPTRTTTNTQGQVGNIYGTAYDRYEERIFSSAYAKRHTQYGTGGSGAIYVSPLGSASAELFATIPNAGGTVHTTPLRSDVSFFTAPGRESLGDIELSEDGTTLWVVNMNDQNLYELDAATGDIRGNAPIPNPGCVGGSWHPMGLGVQDGKVYVGGICDAYDSQLRSDLMASVYESTDGVSFTKVLDHSLDFLRGRANDPGVVDVNTHWNPWYDQFDPTKYYSAWVHAFPQPLLSDIDFDRDGSILLGFRDRFGDQIGYDGLAPDGRHEGSGSSAAGDIIKVCLDGGSYVWEGEGACPSNVVPTYHGGTANSLTSEYFVGESALGTNHQEPGLGSIAPLFRDNDVVMTTIDPLSGAWQQGVQYLDLTDGTGIHAQSGRGGNSRGQLLSSGALTFGKGNGLGDLSILADPAPIQIGNVVWFDEDKDGTQDPNEVPLPGVTVDLLAADGTTVLATATTDAAGEYYFSSLDAPLTPNGEFRVKFTKPADGATVDLGGDHGLVDWANLRLTDQIQGSNTSIDSNADPTSGITPPIQTGAPGADDHTIDAGYTLPPLPSYEHAKTSVPVAGTPVQAGDTITYTVTGSNTGEIALEVDIIDDLTDVLAGAGVTDGPVATVRDAAGDPVADAPDAAVDGTQLSWSGSVPAGGNVAVVYTVTVDDDVAAGTIFENRMSSVATPPPGDWPETIEPEPVSIQHPVPGFEHSKVSDPAGHTAVTGDAPNNVITYTVRGENTGATALDAVIADDLSSVLFHDGTQIGTVTSGPDAVVHNADGTPADGEHPAAVLDGTDLTWTGALAQGQYVEIVYTVTLDAATPGNIVIQNELSSTATPPGGDPITPDEIYVEHPTPEYAHSKTSIPASGTSVLPGDTITYTVTGYNSGAADLTVDVSDDLSDVLAHADMVGDVEYTVLATDDTVVSDGTVELDGTDLVWQGPLAVGERVRIVYTVQVAEDVAPGAIIRNAMTSEAEAGDELILPDPPAIVTEHPVAGYTHDKTSDPVAGTPVHAGETVTYTLTGTNEGAERLDPVVVTDDLSGVSPYAALGADAINGVVIDAGGAVVSTTPAVVDGDVITWTGALDAGEHVEIVYSVTVAEGVVGTLVNHLASHATPEDSTEPIVPADVELEHPIPGYAHAKSSDPVSGTPVVSGDEITYTISGTNTGATALDPVALTDDLSGVLVTGVELVGDPVVRVTDAEGEAVGGDVPAAELDGTTLTWTGSLDIGQHVEIEYTVALDDTVPPGTVLENRFNSAATDPGGTVITPAEEIEQHPTVGYTHDKTSDPVAGTTVHAGESITYTLTGPNTGGQRLDPVVVTDDLAGVSPYAALGADAINGVVIDENGGVVSTTPAAVEGDVITWTGALEPGQRVEIVYSVTVAEGVVGTLVNHLSSQATPEGFTEPITPEDIELEHPIPGYEHAKTSDPVSGTPVDSGDEITYTISGSNTGVTALDPVVLTDDLSGVLVTGVSLVGDPVVRVTDAEGEAVGGDVPAAELDGDTLTWTGTLDAGQHVEIEYTVALEGDILPGTMLANRFDSSATDPGGTVITPAEEIEQHPTVGYVHTKTSDPVAGTPVHAGEAITYTLTGANTGADRLDPVVVTDDLSGVSPYATLGADAVNGVVLDAEGAVVSNTPAVVDGDVITWTGVLEPGQHVEIVYSVTVIEDVVGTLVNHLSSHATPEGSTEPITPPDVELEHPIPGYEHAKTSDPASGTPVVSGDEITYTISGSNTGATALDPVVLTDDLAGVLVTGVSLLGDPVVRLYDASGEAVDGDVPAATLDGTTLSWRGSLEIGQRVEIEYTVALNDTVLPGTVLANRFNSSATDPGGTAITPAEEIEQHPVPGIDIVKFDARDGSAIPAEPVDGPAALGTTPGAWDAGVDADTAFDGVPYEVGEDGTTGPQPVGMIITNTGAVPLANIVVSDETLDGPALTDVVCDFSPVGGPSEGTTWAGPLAPGASFTCTGLLELTAPQTHADRASVDADAVVELPGGETVTVPVTDEDDYHASTPEGTGVDITKRDAASGAEADTTADALIVPAGTTRVVEMPVRNTGQVPLRHVVIGDETTTGPALTNLTCTFPNGDVVVAGADGIVRWEASFTDPDAVWPAGVEFLCTGDLTITAGDPWHADTISVDAETLDGEAVADEDPFVAGVPSIDVVKFDGRVDAPANPVDGPSAAGATPGDWTPGADADTAKDAVLYGTDGDSTGPQPVGIVVTNTGAAPLTNVDVSDKTLAGSDLTGLTCDFSPLGGPKSGTSWSGAFLPGDSFTCVGTVELGIDEEHADTVSVTGDAVVTGVDGKTTTVTVADSDDYHAKTAGLAVTGGTVAGVAAVVVLIGLGFVLFLIGRRRRNEQEQAAV